MPRDFYLVYVLSDVDAKCLSVFRRSRSFVPAGAARCTVFRDVLRGMLVGPVCPDVVLTAEMMIF